MTDQLRDCLVKIRKSRHNSLDALTFALLNYPSEYQVPILKGNQFQAKVVVSERTVKSNREPKAMKAI